MTTILSASSCQYALHCRPAVSVMSKEPEQEFFADGLVEDILTTLSKLSGLSVIARHSTFVYKGRSVDVRQVAQSRALVHG